MFTRSDSFVDLSLRILTGVIVAGLIVALALLLWNFLAKNPPGPNSVPVVEVAPKPAPAPDPVAPPPAKGEVLLNPGQVYRCVVNGRTVFSERPCPGSGETAPAKR
jgi:hypothetical protein